MTRHGLIILALIAAFGAYHMPWVIHPVAAFTNNAFDLAEFMSLSPAVQAESPALYTSLVLRLPIILIAALLTLSGTQLQSEKAKWLTYALAVLLVLRLNPPTVYYPFGGGSFNDQQLGDMMFAGLASILVLIVVGRWLPPLFYAVSTVAGSLLTAAVAVTGYSRSLDVIALLEIEVDLGGGLVLFVGLVLTAGALAAWPLVSVVQHRSLKGQNDMRPAPRILQSNEP